MSQNRPLGVPGRFAGKLAQLPSLPQAAERLTREVLKKEPDLGEIVRIIESDPALVARVLRLVNSPYYGVRWKISTVEHAVGLLGFRAIESMVISLTVFDVLKPRGRHTLDFTRHWQHSLAVAAAARFIAERSQYGAPEEAYTAGMLHDVGRVGLDISAPDDFARLMETFQENSGLTVAIERETIGIDHAAAGEFMLKHWHLDAILAAAVGSHHSEELGGFDHGKERLAAVLQAADLAAWSAGLGWDASAPRIAVSPAVRQHYERIDKEGLFREIEAEMKRAADLFDVSIPDGAHIRASLSAATAALADIHTMQREVERRLARKSNALDVISRLAAGRSQGDDGKKVINRVLSSVVSAIGSERAAFFERNRETGELKLAAVRDVTGMQATLPQAIVPAPREDSALSKCVSHGEAATLSAGDGGVLLEALEIKCALCAPVNVGGHAAGLLVTGNPISARPFAHGDLEILMVLAGEAGIALENHMLRSETDELKAMAETDTLTELNNRRKLLRLLEVEIERSKRYRKPLSLVMIDIDHFKLFNDTYGHQTGDQILKTLGRLLKNSCRAIDTPGRLGGEEFLVVLPETDLEAAAIYAERVRSLVERLGERLKKRYPLHVLTVSVGITSFNHDQDSLDSFVHRADNAMYSAKNRGRNRVCAL